MLHGPAPGVKHAVSLALRNASPRFWHTLKYRQYLHSRAGEREIHHLAAWVDPKKIAIDAGVYFGFYTRRLGELAEVIGFEPHEDNYAWAVRSLPYGTQLHHVALSDEDGFATLRVPIVGEDKGATALGTCAETNDLGGAPYRSYIVAKRRLDSLQLPPVGFIKIDVEGYEEFVIRGAMGVIRRDRPNLMIEIEERHNPGGFDRIACRSLGYRSYHLAAGGRLARVPPGIHIRTLQSADGIYINNFLFFPG